MFCGCSNTGFLAARGRDFADVFTCTIGTGAGAKVRAGPVQVAVFENSDLFGLRAGRFFADGNSLVFNEETHLPLPMSGDGWLCGQEAFHHGIDSVSTRRGKEVLASSFFPLVVIGHRAPFYTQIEAAAGLGLTVRLGFNVGEFLDFLLGWVGIDLYGDDRIEPMPARP